MKPIWMHVTFGTAILVGAVVLIRSQNKMVQETTRDTITKVLVEAGKQMAIDMKREAQDTVRGVVGEGEDYRKLADVTGEDPSKFAAALIRTTFRAMEGIDGASQELIGISPAEENQLGALGHEARMKLMTVYPEPILNQRLNQLAAPIIKECKRKGLAYKITVIDNPTVNAYSAMGGYLYVNTGLLAKYQSDAEIQFVLAHEIGHIDLGHPMRMYSYAKKVAEHLGKDKISLASELYACVARGYSSELEFAADAFAFKAMRKHGRTRDEALASLRLAQKTEEDENDGPVIIDERPDNLPDAIEATLRAHFKTHPSAKLRVERLEKPAVAPQPVRTAQKT